MPKDNTGFKLPKKFLEQLSEFSRGYYLVTCNELGNIESFACFDNPIVKLGIVNYTDAQIGAMQEHLRMQALNNEESMHDGPDTD